MKEAVLNHILAWWSLFHDGGPVMYPIFLCSVAALTIIFERLWMLRVKHVINESLMVESASLMRGGKFAEARAALEASDTSLARVIVAGLGKMGRRRDVIRETMQNAGSREGYNLSQFVNMLGGIAGLAPLLGFLGTVYGMILAFYQIYRTGVTTSSEVAGGIAQALITTAAGLTVAIPTYIAYRYFLARVDNLMTRMEDRSAEYLDLIDEAPERKEAAP